MTATRTFTEAELASRDAFVVAEIEADCDGCRSTHGTDGYEAWTPAEHCPVHGIHAETFWKQLNEDLDRRWPGTWS